MKTLLIVALAAALTACGGGGSVAPPDNSQAIKAAADALTAKYPVAPKFEGAFVSVDGISQGYVAGTSGEDIAKRLAATVQSDPVKYDTYYRKLLSADGLKIVVFGESTGTNQFGVLTHKPDVVYTVKLAANGSLAITY